MPDYGIWLSGYRNLLTKGLQQLPGRLRRGQDPRARERPGGRREANSQEPRPRRAQGSDGNKLLPPIECITPAGIQTRDGHVELEFIIYATDFDGVTGALDRIEIRGKDGVALKDAWADGPATYLGLQLAGFPNFFTLVGAHNGAAFCNIGVCGALQVEWVSRMIGYMHGQGFQYAEPSVEAQEQWTDQVYRVYAKTLLADSDTRCVKTTRNSDGTLRRRALIYVGGTPEYRDHCENVAGAG